MRIDKATQACLAVRAAFVPTEAEIDQTLARLGSILVTTSTQRVEADISYALPQQGFEELGRAIGQMIEVRQTLATAHATFAAVGRQLLPESAFGDDGCPGMPKKFTGELTVVAAA